MVEGKVAIVFGASGVSGWSFVNEILNDYPKKGVWSGVLALTNRPLTVEESFWPPDDRLSITSGINLLEDSPETIQKKLSDIAGIKKVTHLIYLGKSKPFLFKGKKNQGFHTGTNWYGQHTRQTRTTQKRSVRMWRCSSARLLLWTRSAQTLRWS